MTSTCPPQLSFTRCDLQHLNIAQGYVQLEMWLDATDEIEQIPPKLRHSPSVLELRLAIYQGLQDWSHAGMVAAQLIKVEPANPNWAISQALAARYVSGLESAKALLLPVLVRLPHAAILHYDLACYEFQLGEAKVARARLQTAFRLDPKYRLLALEEINLKPLWTWIKNDDSACLNYPEEKI